MWSQFLDGEVISKIGSWGGLGLAFVTLFSFLRKNQVITTLTSSKVERLLSSKEKRTVIKILNFIMFVIIGFIFSIILTIAYYNLSSIESIIPVVIIVGILAYLIVAYIMVIKRTAFDKYLSESANLKLTMIIFMIQMLSFFSIGPLGISFLILDGKINLTFNQPEELLNNLLLCGVVLVVFVLLSATTLVQLRDKFSKYHYECFYILEQGNTNERWFIYHLMDNERFLLGNKEFKQDATVFRTEERSKILTEKIFLLKLLKNNEESIEYHI
ncbi:hypothetical protein [Paenibacillus hubeiensis]|uniref:hypothetical protein n=1 Tax=Paenibacillus hubeiensis TaxID=3077330 RepID=UPI0031BB00AE